MAKTDDNMKRRGFFCSDKLYSAVETIADDTGTPVAEHIRAALANYIKLHTKVANEQPNRANT
jgi:hypothetical protein